MRLSPHWAHRLIAGLTGGLIVLCSAIVAVSAQDKCLQPGRLETLRKELAERVGKPENKKLREELIEGAKKLGELGHGSAASGADNAKPAEELARTAATWATRTCNHLNTQGWPRRLEVGDDGARAFLFIVSKALPPRMQLEVYPIVSEAYRAGEIEGSQVLASYVDRLRLSLGRKQLYGTQAYVRDGFLVMAPIENIAEIDKRRSIFELSPLRSYERSLELQFRMPLVRLISEPPLSTTLSARPQTESMASADTLAQLGDETPIVVETAFVSLDVIVPDAVTSGSTSLEKGDFQLFDSGKLVEIETFAKAEAPFDIVLLLDLSGSTADKVGLIKKTTRRFVEMKRPIDRVAVVTFHDRQTVVSELESDSSVLLGRIKDIGGRGGSNVWDSVRFALDMLDEKSTGGRRKAVVLMSDGVDNQLSFYPTLTKRISFADLVERVQRSTAAVFPIYLDTEDDRPGSRRVYADARRTLSYLADQSAGNMYTAKKLDDLNDIYDRVLKDVGTVYTLGFTPDVESGSQQWRALKVEIPSRPNLKIKHRPGYFTR
jgi:VWFA-related protein